MTPQQELRYLKMKLGTWNLVPSLITPETMWQKTLIYEGGRTLWGFYAGKAKQVKTCEDVQEHMVSMVQGGWQRELANILEHCCCDMGMLQALYADSEDCTQQHFDQHFKFMASLISARAKSLVAQCCKPPYRYSSLCRPETMAACMEQMQAEWEVIMEAEERIAAGHSCLPLAHMHFARTPWCRLHYLANGRDMRLGSDDSVHLARTAIQHIGDTVVIENTHQKMKDLLHVARHSQISRVAKFQTMINSGVLESRDIPNVKVSDYDKACSSAEKDGSRRVVQTTHPNSHKMQKAYQNVMKYKASSPNFTWPSSSHSSLFGEAAALEFLLPTGVNAEDAVLGNATMACLVGGPGSLVAAKHESTLILVIASSIFNFLGWRAHVVGEVDGYNQIQICQGPGSLAWFSVGCLEDWLSVPAKPMLQNRYGPLVLLQTGSPLDLLHARVLEGLSLTNKQAEFVLKHYGQKPEGKLKRTLYMQIFELFLDSMEDREAALKRSNCNTNANDDAGLIDDDDLSDYQDLLDFVEECGNAQDPELKQEKRKVWERKARKAKFQSAKLLDEKQANKRGRGRGKGKGRGRKLGLGRGKGRGKTKGRKKRETEPEAPQPEPQESELEAAQVLLEEKLQTGKEERDMIEAEERLQREAEERLQREAEERLQREAEERLQKEAEERLQKEGGDKAQLDAEQAPGTAVHQKLKRDPKLHESPAILSSLCPPEGKITLNHKDHRTLVCNDVSNIVWFWCLLAARFCFMGTLCLHCSDVQSFR